MRSLGILFLAVTFYFCFSQPPLPHYNIKVKGTSTTYGVSSGALMAVQMEVVYSSYFQGAAILAGGPYDCAQGSITIATTTCMKGVPTPNASKYAQITTSRAASGLVDPIYHLSNHSVYMFSGLLDPVVDPKVMDALYQYYVNFMPAKQIQFVNNISAGHTIPTDDPNAPNLCSETRSPWVGYCAYDSAGFSLQKMYGSLNPRNNGVLNGKVISFNQKAFTKNTRNIGMSDTGYLFVPDPCSKGELCTLLVAFHGCLDNVDAVGQWFINGTGLNKWADTNKIVILYPQTIATVASPTNPEGCWDWWGYNDPFTTVYDTNQGAQMMMIKAMMDWIGAGYADS